MRRILIGIVAGAFVAFACIFLVEYLDARLFPLPAGVDPTTAAGDPNMAAHMAFGARILVVAGWCVGTAAGAAIAARMAHRRLAGWVIAAIVVAQACVTLSQILHPGWMVAAGLILPWACAWAVQGAAHYRRP